MEAEHTQDAPVEKSSIMEEPAKLQETTPSSAIEETIDTTYPKIIDPPNQSEETVSSESPVDKLEDKAAPAGTSSKSKDVPMEECKEVVQSEETVPSESLVDKVKDQTAPPGTSSESKDVPIEESKELIQSEEDKEVTKKDNILSSDGKGQDSEKKNEFASVCMDDVRMDSTVNEDDSQDPIATSFLDPMETDNTQSEDTLCGNESEIIDPMSTTEDDPMNIDQTQETDPIVIDKSQDDSSIKTLDTELLTAKDPVRVPSPIIIDEVMKDDSNEAKKDSVEGMETQTDFVDTEESQSNDNVPENLEEDPISENNKDTEDTNENVADLGDDPISDENKDMENEMILPVDDEKEEKYTLSHCQESVKKQCGICEKNIIPKYLAQKNVESLYICEDECLVVFKEKNSDNFIEKILRLRSFAKADETKQPEQPSEEFEFLGEQEPVDPTPSNPLRKCGSCKGSININNYVSWEAVDYCNEGCLLRFQKTINKDCAKCRSVVADNLLGKFCVRFGNTITQFCSTICLLAYKKASKFCAYCQQDFHEYSGSATKNFCSQRCLQICQPYSAKKEIECCAVCNKIKNVELKIRGTNKMIFFCGEPCFVAYKFVNSVDPSKCEVCVTHFEPEIDDPLIYSGQKTHLLCSKACQKIFLITNRKIVECRICSVKKYDFDMIKLCVKGKELVYSCSNNCLKFYFEKSYQEEIISKTPINLKKLEAIAKTTNFTVKDKTLYDIIQVLSNQPKIPAHKITITKPKQPVKQRNVATMCKPNLHTKSVQCKPKAATISTQTEKEADKIFLPVPVPIFVPLPLHMYAQLIPTPVPIPIPLPVPIFIPTSRKSIAGITKEIQKIKNRVPANPLEAELLMMAEMAAGEKKEDSSSASESEDVKNDETFQSDGMDASTSFGEDVLTMALKMADDFEGSVDLEGVVTPSTISAQSTSAETVDTKRPVTVEKRKPGRPRTKPRKPEIPPVISPQINLETEKPDANLCLKYTFGVNAWKQWVTTKNIELQKTQLKPKLFKPEILQLTADDLNYSLCMFVKEVRKPSGAEYAPDTIYYLCLGIQQYLYENGRIDNIFCDAFYEKFTETFNEICQKFANLYNDSQYIVTRVEEEHLWESKQLGAHSPLVLLNTLMFFNTKHFSLTTVDEHLQLSFSHIMKHWKRNPNLPGARNVLLRFYPPQGADGSRKKKVYEQQENDVNPLRCPVKLYEFYLSKCPESVKTRNDVFYLQPERSCVPDSPVWYSTMALAKEPLEKMLNRVKMVKEINVALLTT